MDLAKLYKNALERLPRRSADFAAYDSFDDWLTDASDDQIAADAPFFHYIKHWFLIKYRERGIYIAPTALDDIVFAAVKKGVPADLPKDIEQAVHAFAIHRNSVVIFPLHSFGLLGEGLWNIRARSVQFNTDSFSVAAQTNSLKRTHALLLDYLDRHAIPNRRKLDFSLIEHYYKSRGLRWLDRNPLMLMHFRFSQLTTFDNLHAVLQHVHFATSKLYVLGALPASERDSLTSTRRINNFETLDIRHFLVLATSRGALNVNCLPVFNDRHMAFSDTNINCEIQTRRLPRERWRADLIVRIDDLQQGYRSFRLSADKRYLKYNRLTSSLEYFRKAMKAVTLEDQIVFLNTAFELLLLDDREHSKRDLMLSRSWRLMRQSRGLARRDLVSCLEELINERNAIIHGGAPASKKVEVLDVARVYLRLLLQSLQLARRMDSTKPKYLTTFFDAL